MSDLADWITPGYRGQRYKSLSEAARWLGGVGVVVFLAISGWTFYRTHQLSAHADASVVSVEVGAEIVEFTDSSGAQQQARIPCSHDSCPRQFPQGSTAPIVYSPSNPATARFAMDVSHKMVVVWAGFAAGCFVIFCLGCIKPLTQRRTPVAATTIATRPPYQAPPPPPYRAP